MRRQISMKKLAVELEERGLYDQVFMGIDNHFKNESVKELVLARIDNCWFQYMNISVNTLGVCYRSHQIEVNPILVDHPKEYNDTLLHETAHLIKNVSDEYYNAGKEAETPNWKLINGELKRIRKRRTPHGIEWKQICKAIGGVPETRCHDKIVAKALRQERIENAKHVYYCKDCGYEWYYMRKMKGTRFHTKCKHKENNGRIAERKKR